MTMLYLDNLASWQCWSMIYIINEHLFVADNDEQTHRFSKRKVSIPNFLTDDQMFIIHLEWWTYVHRIYQDWRTKLSSNWSHLNYEHNEKLRKEKRKQKWLKRRQHNIIIRENIKRITIQEHFQMRMARFPPKYMWRTFFTSWVISNP